MPEPVSFCRTMMSSGAQTTMPTLNRSPGRPIENE